MNLNGGKEAKDREIRMFYYLRIHTKTSYNMNIGDILNGYEIIDNIGSGGMGTVYKVFRNGEYFALKICKQSDEESIKRFKREVRLMRSVKDKNVMEVIDEKLDSNPPYFIMPLCELSLKEATNKGLKEDILFEYVFQLCMGVKMLHDNGIIHRDVKPANALIINNEVKVADLGLGKFEVRESSILTGSSNHTIGTYEYVSPEIFLDGKSRDATKKSDIFSIGKSIYYIFSNGENPQFVNPDKVKADIFPIIRKCTEINPLLRYNDVSEIINDLLICQQSRDQIISMKDIIEAHKAHTISNSVFSDKVYQYLLTLQDDLSLFIRDLKAIGRNDFMLLLDHKPDDIDNLINLFLTTYENNQYYWIQFEEVDILVNRAQMLLQRTSKMQEKYKLLEFAIKISKNYNRYPAMEIVGDMLHDFSDDDLKSMSVFFTENKDDINAIKTSFKKQIPDSVRYFLK